MKNYTINYKTSPYNPDYYCCEVRFKVVDGVPVRDILEALKASNQEKLEKAFNAQGVHVFVKRGYMLGSISKELYNAYIKK